MIADQISVLNQDYAPSGLQFLLVNTTRTTNWYWFNEAGPNSDAQTQMKQQVCTCSNCNSYHVTHIGNSFGRGVLPTSTSTPSGKCAVRMTAEVTG